MKLFSADNSTKILVINPFPRNIPNRNCLAKMIVSSAKLPKFGPERSKEVISTLTQLFTELQPSPPPGFLYSMLLRPEDDGNSEAVLLTLWESNVDLERFVASAEGSKMVKRMNALLGDGGRPALDRYFVTWQSDVYEPRPAQACCGPIDGRSSK